MTSPGVMHWLLYQPGTPLHVACLPQHPFPSNIKATTNVDEVTCPVCLEVIMVAKSRALYDGA